MSCTKSPFRARHKAAYALASLALLGVALCVPASSRPKYGGTLRVEIGERVASVDPREWPSDSEQAAATERVASLVFDRLARFDDRGAPAPALAVSWQNDLGYKRWEFHLRPGVRFSDGTPLTTESAALALQQLLGNSFDVSADGDAVVIQSDQGMPDLPALLAAGRFFIFRTALDGSIYGTGPFEIAGWPASLAAAGPSQKAADAGGKVMLRANESCWAGRPFVDEIEIAMGASGRQQANAVAFGDADVVELSASQARDAAQRGVRSAGGAHTELYALQFDVTQTAAQDARIREAVSLTVDRASLAEVILQRQGMPAGGLLPNWVSGYAFLFPPTRDLARARDLLSAARSEVSRVPAIQLNYDFSDSTIPGSDDEARAIAERVAINLREAGIAVELLGQNRPLGGKTAANPKDGVSAPPFIEVRLVRRRISVPDARMALADLLTSFGEPAASLATAQDAYDAERETLGAFRVIPLVHVSETYGLGPRVRDFLAPRWGGWRLEDVWLAQPQTAGAGAAQ